MTKTKKLRVAIYVRKSPDDKIAMFRGKNLTEQEAICKQFCIEQGYDIDTLQVYKDTSSGDLPLEKRKGLGRLIEDSKKNKFDVVVAYKTDRLARRMMSLLHVVMDLENHNIKFCSATEQVDTSTRIGRLNLNFLGAVAEFERNAKQQSTTN